MTMQCLVDCVAAWAFRSATPITIVVCVGRGEGERSGQGRKEALANKVANLHPMIITHTHAPAPHRALPLLVIVYVISVLGGDTVASWLQKAQGNADAVTVEIAVVTSGGDGADRVLGAATLAFDDIDSGALHRFVVPTFVANRGMVGVSRLVPRE